MTNLKLIKNNDNNSEEKEDEKTLVLKIQYVDGSEEEYECEYFGVSSDFENYLIIGFSEENSKESDNIHLINLDHILKLMPQEVEKENVSE